MKYEMQVTVSVCAGSEHDACQMIMRQLRPNLRRLADVTYIDAEALKAEGTPSTRDNA